MVVAAPEPAKTPEPVKAPEPIAAPEAVAAAPEAAPKPEPKAKEAKKKDPKEEKKALKKAAVVTGSKFMPETCAACGAPSFGNWKRETGAFVCGVCERPYR